MQVIASIFSVFVCLEKLIVGEFTLIMSYNQNFLVIKK